MKDKDKNLSVSEKGFKKNMYWRHVLKYITRTAPIRDKVTARKDQEILMSEMVTASRDKNL